MPSLSVHYVYWWQIVQKRQQSNNLQQLILIYNYLHFSKWIFINKWLSLHKHYSRISHSLLYLESTNTNSESVTVCWNLLLNKANYTNVKPLAKPAFFFCFQMSYHFISPGHRSTDSILYLSLNLACPNETVGRVYFALYQYSANQHLLSTMGLLNPACLGAQTALWPQMWLVNCTSKEDKSTQQYFIHQGNLQWITASLWLRLFLIYCFYSVFNHKWAPYEAFTMQNWQLFISTRKIFLDNNVWLWNILSSLNSYIIFLPYLMMQCPL